MKTILWMFLFGAASAVYAQAKPPAACDELKGQEKEACLKNGGTVKANSASGGSTAKQQDPDWPKNPHRLSGDRYAEPGAPTDYTTRDDKKRESR